MRKASLVHFCSNSRRPSIRMELTQLNIEQLGVKHMVKTNYEEQHTVLSDKSKNMDRLNFTKHF